LGKLGEIDLAGRIERACYEVIARRERPLEADCL
jgi:hypothetical protein